MKKSLFLSILMIVPLLCSGQQVDAPSQKMIDQYMKSNMVSTSVPIDIKSTEKVFNGSFFKTDLEGPLFPGGDQGRRPYNTFIFNIYQEKVTDVLMEPKNMVQLVRKDFLLKNEASALLFEKAIYALFPVLDELKKTHPKKGNDWLFTVGDENFRRIWVVTVTPAGVISNIELKTESGS